MIEAIPPILQYAFMAWCSVKVQDNFTFFYLYYEDVWGNGGMWQIFGNMWTGFVCFRIETIGRVL
jgi:hypothetical protein